MKQSKYILHSFDHGKEWSIWHNKKWINDNQSIAKVISTNHEPNRSWCWFSYHNRTWATNNIRSKSLGRTYMFDSLEAMFVEHFDMFLKYPSIYNKRLKGHE